MLDPDFPSRWKAFGLVEGRARELDLPRRIRRLVADGGSADRAERKNHPGRRTKAESLRRKTAQATAGAPAASRQLRQWHRLRANGGALTRNLIAPQRHPPS